MLNFVCHAFFLQRTAVGARKDEADVDTANGSADDTHSMEKDDTHSKEKEPAQSPTNLVFGYLNLFSDGVVCVPLLFALKHV